MPLVSIIITNYNGEKYLSNCIDSLRRNSFSDFEIIVVDNASSDGSVKILKQKYPQVKLLQLDENLGLSVASNKGREIAKGEYLFFYNNDTIADTKLLSELLRAVQSDPTLGICGCRTLSYDGTRKINSGVPLDIFGYPYGKDKCFYVDAGIFIARDLFDQLGGFDSKMFLYCEDRDLCWRCWLYGYKVKASDSAVFKHDSFCSVDEKGNLTTNVHRRFMAEAFTMRTLLKNYSLPVLIAVLPVYVFINCMEMLLFLFKRRWDIILGTYIKAYQWNLSNLGDTLKLRKRIQSQRRVSDTVILKQMYHGSGKLKLFKKVGVPVFG